MHKVILTLSCWNWGVYCLFGSGLNYGDLLFRVGSGEMTGVIWVESGFAFMMGEILSFCCIKFGGL